MPKNHIDATLQNATQEFQSSTILVLHFVCICVTTFTNTNNIKCIAFSMSDCQTLYKLFMFMLYCGKDSGTSYWV